ncbi:TetR/AcrR family transcriptional regulator [Nocardia jejuensis]|uniref:TetR/AcrR family transcriptional regulator n=1 Tax=Nocardia jejuensis TaxID=328049 RepID=UPI001FE10771|nr:TetR/AcrR family transcriptional regulator [Nocardia jejuensis]
MLVGGVELLRERGPAGVTIDAVLARTRTPRGSVYHHFPGGRQQIVGEALEMSGSAISAIIQESAQDGPASAFAHLIAFWKKLLRENDFEAGCPVVAVAIAGSAQDDHRDRAREIIGGWLGTIADSLVRTGATPARARTLATLVVSSVEGAVVLCRTTRSTAPLDDVAGELRHLFADLDRRPAE